MPRIPFETEFIEREDYNGLMDMRTYGGVREHDESRFYHRRVPFTSPLGACQ